ncbi:galactokinase [Acidiferrimicrobium sp. IK]|uniref:galactokinase n=1 Tax=Acidiferrimicrobium sp. IK TaxID=2871700 RepID=UPI0021CB200D|nr:galactokinase family protein [Acidiferrimicrobium sp. IK]
MPPSLSSEPAGRAADLLRRRSGGAADLVWQAPGRANLIGEHTDYNGGWALPFAIDRVTAVAVRRRDGPGLRAWSAQEPEMLVWSGPAPLGAAGPTTANPGVPPWGRYVLGAVAALAGSGVEVPAADVAIDSDVPVGAGVSSSAAVLIATIAALAALAGAEPGAASLAAMAHRAETIHAGVPVGWLDHLGIAHATPGHAALIDFSTGAWEPVPLQRGPLLVVDSHVRHDNAAGGYRRRREECAQAARLLGTADLRAATREAVESGLEGSLRRRARHVVTENGRVLTAAGRLRAGKPLGDLLWASHASLRDEFEASCPELDLIVDTSRSLGADGARMMGGGFGGSALVLGLPAAALAGALASAFERRGQRPPAVWEVAAAGGPAPA